MSGSKEERLKEARVELADASRALGEAERAWDAAGQARVEADRVWGIAIRAWDEANRKVRAIEGEP